MRIISGEFGGRRLKTITGPGYRPATDKVRQAIFSLLESRGVLWQDIQAADLFAGSGSLGLECLSRGAQQVWFVEKNRRALGLIRENLSALQVPAQRYFLCNQDVLTWLYKSQRVNFDLIFIDPPYGHGLIIPVLRAVLKQGWIKEHGLILAEVESRFDIQSDPFPGVELLLNRTYGQTRICLWLVSNRR